MNIVPALLNHSIDEFSSQLERLLPYYQHFHIDIADGILVPNTTLQLEDILPVCLQHTGVEFDFHLMVKDYESRLKTLTEFADKIKIDTVLIHFSVLTPEVKDSRTSTSGVSFTDQLNHLTMNKYKIGIVLDPLDTVTQLQSHYNLRTIDAIQVMTIQPGFQGQPFKPELLGKFDELRTAGYTGELLVDGSMNDTTIPLLKELKNKLDIVNVGSYLSRAKNIEERIKELQQLLS